MFARGAGELRRGGPLKRRQRVILDADRAALSVESSPWAKNPQSNTPTNRKRYHGASIMNSTRLWPPRLLRLP